MKARRQLEIAVLIILAILLAVLIYSRTSGDEGSKEQTNTDVLSAGKVSETAPADAPSTEPTATPTPAPAPTPTAEPLPDIDLDDWRYVLVNAGHQLDKTFTPNVTELEGGQYFDSRAVEDLKTFIAAARAEGLTVLLRSSYRPYYIQESLYLNKVLQMQSWHGYDYPTAAAEARKIVAYPGTSEHQLGLACDIVDGYYEYMNESLADTKLLQWMVEHCAEYGFILRYPKDTTDITGVSYEPWHFRYVGAEAAAYIMEKDLTLEEFLELYV